MLVLVMGGQVLDLSIITHEILVGTQVTALEDFDTLRKLGVGGLLNLQEDDDLKRMGLDWSVLAKAGMEKGIDMRRCAIRDFDSGDQISKIKGCVAELDDLISEYRRVYVHCTAGINRSPGIVMSYLVLKKSYTVAEAYRMIRSKRPQAAPYRTLMDALASQHRDEITA
jgi:hypothetical protein